MNLLFLSNLALALYLRVICVSVLLCVYVEKCIGAFDEMLFLVVDLQVKEAMQRIHDRGNIGKLILDVEKSPTPLVT